MNCPEAVNSVERVKQDKSNQKLHINHDHQSMWAVGLGRNGKGHGVIKTNELVHFCRMNVCLRDVIIKEKKAESKSIGFLPLVAKTVLYCTPNKWKWTKAII